MEYLIQRDHFTELQVTEHPQLIVDIDAECQQDTLASLSGARPTRQTHCSLAIARIASDAIDSTEIALW